MLKLKTISLLGHRSELDALPEGKLLINTINAHSYNTALKDPAFAEALLRGDALMVLDRKSTRLNSSHP